MRPRINMQTEWTRRYKWKKYFKETREAPWKAGYEWWEDAVKGDAKVFSIVWRTQWCHLGETEHSKGVFPTSQVHTHSHWGLERVALSLEFSVRWFHLRPYPRKFIPGSPRRISLQHHFSLTPWLCNLHVIGESPVRLQSIGPPCKLAQRPEIPKKFWWANRAKLTRSKNTNKNVQHDPDFVWVYVHCPKKHYQALLVVGWPD